MRELVKWLSITDRFSKMYLNKNFEKLGINSSHHMFVLKICENEGITQDNLQPLVHINRSNITRALAQLEKNGFIYKKPCNRDKRTVCLFPTAKAKNIYQEIINIEMTWIDVLTNKFTKEEKEQFLLLVKKAGGTAVGALREEEEE